MLQSKVKQTCESINFKIDEAPSYEHVKGGYSRNEDTL